MKRLLIPETLTPLYFTSLYSDLNREDQVAYNRIYGLYFLEQTIFFEQIMGNPSLSKIGKIAKDEEIRRVAAIFVNEENTHSNWFRALLREEEPSIYNETDFHILGASPFLRIAMSMAARMVHWLPCLLWLQLIAEERALYFSRIFMEHSANVDPRFLDVQKRHLADEVAHIRYDEMFLRHFWPSTIPWRRRLNARLLKWMLKEFFYLPKRSGWNVVQKLLKSSPHLQTRRGAFRQAMASLSTNDDYLRTLYPRAHLKRTDALAARWPELDFLKDFLTD